MRIVSREKGHADGLCLLSLEAAHCEGQAPVDMFGCVDLHKREYQWLLFIQTVCLVLVEQPRVLDSLSVLDATPELIAGGR